MPIVINDNGGDNNINNDDRTIRKSTPLTTMPNDKTDSQTVHSHIYIYIYRKIYNIIYISDTYMYIDCRNTLAW